MSPEPLDPQWFVAAAYAVTLGAIVTLRAFLYLRQRRLKEEWEALHES